MLTFFSGLFLFLGGLEGSKWAIKNLVNEKIIRLILALDKHFYLSIFMGIIITAIMQSSSAVSVILIGLIEAGVLSLKPAIGIMIGANIGTTVTGQILTYPIVNYYPYLISLGLCIGVLSLFIKKETLFYIGTCLFFYGLIFVGLILMTRFFQSPEKRKLIEIILQFSGKNIILGILLGAVITAIIQSSSALTGIVIGLAFNNLISLRTAISLTLGSNMGTCFTAFLASINSGHFSQKLAKGHFVFNLLGVLALLPLFYPFEAIVRISSPELTRQIANAQTYFNIFNTIIILPFINTFISWLMGKEDDLH
ncbi:MAG TPA: Na/Pi cotransporter family protein [Halanaerobiaceae bacterium]|jgi:phosphate:Na+ symporter|nr:Na/Pi symporter [Bacillota bacterium]HHU93201.1 Na/Pi cotransporter family protein [Halanaerobiaceae bacterium]HOA41284.1 Na/Pi symporter [Halanaerobiales bacterium]HPZ62524.1 Na/Pi symporter [Halanaerobiales bacterium]HQD03743.1 Na/Pi symporter [Halanaerobiales bacterium]